MTTDVATRPEDIAAAVGVPVGALAIRSDQTELTDAQRRALGHIGLKDCPPADVEAFLHLCQRTGLDPWARQIYLIERREKKGDQWVSKWQPQTGIDGFRIIAQRSGRYAGQDPPQWCGPDGVWVDVWLDDKPPAAARVRVHRDDKPRPFEAVAVFREYAQYTSQGALTSMWKTKPSLMIAKCARAAAFREAFPQDMSGLFISEEVDVAEARHARTTRVASHRDTGPVDVAELTGRPAPAPEAPAAPAGRANAARAARPDLPDGTQMITNKQEKELGKLFDEAKVSDRAARLRVVATLADREITSARHLSYGEARDLLSHLADLGPDSIAALADAANKPSEPSEPVDAEVVDEPATSGDDQVSDAEWQAMEADRDAAQGTLDDTSADR